MRRIKASTIATVGFLLTFAIYYTYAHSITIVYGGIELLISAVSFLFFLTNYNWLDRTMRRACVALLVISFIMGLLNADLKSTLLITTPLIMPFVFLSFDIDYSRRGSNYLLTAILVVVISNYSINLKTYNSNSIGFMTMMGVSVLLLWVRTARYKTIPIVFVLIGSYIAATSGSRNVTVAVLGCLCLVLIPTKLFEKPVFYWGLCGTILLYTLISAEFMEWGFSNSTISLFLHNITGQYSQKAWDMAKRVDDLRSIKQVIDLRGSFRNIFGDGVLTIHGHNLFYQCVLDFGYFGTGLIYLMFARVFKFAFDLIRNNHDEVAVGCVIALLGNLLLNGADVYMIGPESYAIIPQIFMGMIMQRFYVSQMGWLDDFEMA